MTSAANPSLSPELQAKATVVDFTVTAAGLEDQLLSTVVQHEQRTLDEQLRGVYADIAANSAALVQLNDALLKRLSQSQGNLLDDTTLMAVLTGMAMVVCPLCTQFECVTASRDELLLLCHRHQAQVGCGAIQAEVRIGDEGSADGEARAVPSRGGVRVRHVLHHAGRGAGQPHVPGTAVSQSHPLHCLCRVCLYCKCLCEFIVVF